MYVYFKSYVHVIEFYLLSREEDSDMGGGGDFFDEDSSGDNVPQRGCGDIRFSPVGFVAMS